MWWDFNFYKNETQIPTVLGDIAVCQEVSNHVDGQKSRGKDTDNFTIRVGQAIGSWMIKSSSNSEHAAIVYQGWDAGEDTGRICDANVTQGFRGIATRHWKPRPAYIYRCNDDALRHETGRIAHVIASKVRASVRHAGVYDWKKAGKSVLKFKYVDSESTRFVDQCYDFAYGDGKDLPGMFCSEFVVVCTMLAGKHLDRDLGSLNVDPRAISPKALQSLLERSSLFARMGRPFLDGT